VSEDPMMHLHYAQSSQRFKEKVDAVKGAVLFCNGALLGTVLNPNFIVVTTFAVIGLLIQGWYLVSWKLLLNEWGRYLGIYKKP
jgi:hypothetical protein